MRPRQSAPRLSLPTALRRGPMSATALAAAIGASPRGSLRMLGEAQANIVSFGAAGRTRYAWRHPLRGETGPLPLFSVDAQGRVAEVAALSLIEPAGSHCALGAAGWPVDAASRDGLWDGLPYPLYDMQPQGFLGRSFARREHRSLEVASDPREWSDDDVTFVLSRRGSDTGGNLILGELALQGFQHELARPAEALPATATAAAYLQMAEATVAQGLAGSSAAGEFPKFTALRELPGAASPHVIVKFSGPLDAPATRRWGDLLVCEHLAGTAVAGLPGLAAARSRVLQSGERLFLESERFDRPGRFGRSALVSLQAIDGHLFGLSTQDWRVHARTLAGHALLSAEDALAVQRLWWFGRLIANSDMHLGNLSFVPQAGRLVLAPSYDMLPMAFAPLPGGEVPALHWAPELPPPAQAAVWQEAAAAALAFWQQAAADGRISAGFRAQCATQAAGLQTLIGRV